MEHFTKQMKRAYKILKQLQILVRTSIENEEPYTSEQHLQDLVDEFEMYFRQAYYDVESERDMEWRKRLHNKEETICALRTEMLNMVRSESLTLSEIDAAKTKIDMNSAAEAKKEILDNIYFGESLTISQREKGKTMFNKIESTDPEAEEVLFEALKGYEI